MKSTEPSPIALSIICAAAILTGCGIVRKAYTPVVTSTTIPISTVTNGVVMWTTNTVWTTNYAPNQNVITGINTVSEIGGAAGIPWARTAGELLVFLYAAGASLVGIKTSKEKKQAEEAGKVLTQNVDTARDFIKALSPPEPTTRVLGVSTPEEKFVDKIAAKQVAAGVQATVEKLRN